MSSLKKDLDKYFPRKEQEDCIKFINEEWNKNKESKIFLLNLPTGVGKSHLALMIADWYKKNVSKGSRVDIITNSKILQDQYVNTYNSINDLKGKENYECSQYTCSCAEGQEFNKLNKTKCESCPYSGAKESFINGNISLTNFYLYILYTLYMPELLKMRGSKVLIVDEAHILDDVMSDFISIKITENVIKRLKFSDEKGIISDLKKVKTISEYVSFLEELERKCAETIGEIDRSMSFDRNVKNDKRDNKISKILNQKNADSKLMTIISDLKKYQSKIEIFLKEHKSNPDNWVLESSWNEKTKQKELSLEPIWASDYLDKYIFSNYDMVFLMSGTILDKNLFCQLNGLDIDKTVYYSIDSPFDVKNRI